MTQKTLRYTAHTDKEGYRQLDETLFQFGLLYNALITHRRSRSSTHRHVRYLNVQNSHITDLHRNDPTLHRVRPEAAGIHGQEGEHRL